VVISKINSSVPANSQKPRAVAGRNVKNPFWSPAYRAVMNTTHTPRRVLAVALLSGGVALAGIGLAADTAQAQTGIAPQFSWPHRGRQLLGSSSLVPWVTLAGERCRLGHEHLPHLVLGARRRDG
jgi:hypothetical protein